MTRVAVLVDAPLDGPTRPTEFGPSAPLALIPAGASALVAASPRAADPRATIRALRDEGVTHVWLLEGVGALTPLLEPGDWIVPDDFADGTRGQHYTYFTEKAGGYVQQVPPLDPASRAALLAGLRAVTPRPFQRGVYACVSHSRLETPAEAAFWARAGAHVAGRYLSPSLVLARELELRVAVLARVTRAGGAPGEADALAPYLEVLAGALDALASAGGSGS